MCKTPQTVLLITGVSLRCLQLYVKKHNVSDSVKNQKQQHYSCKYYISNEEIKLYVLSSHTHCDSN